MTDWLENLPKNRLLAELSLWSADMGRLAEEIARVEPYADFYHIDAADGHFSPALLFFPDLVAACRQYTAKPLHIHLMATDGILEDQIRQFAAAGADAISIHAENGRIESALALLEKLGLVSGLVLQLTTPVEAALPYLDRIGLLTVLGTEIGIKGKGLDPRAEPRLREATRMIAARKSAHRILLAADGGIREHTVAGLRRAGAQAIVMGSLAFGTANLPERMAWIHSLESGIGNG